MKVNEIEYGGKHFAQALIKAWVDLSYGSIDRKQLVSFTGMPLRMVNTLVNDLVVQGAIKEEI